MNNNLNPVIAQALRPFMPQAMTDAMRTVDAHRPVPPANKPASVPKGLYEYQYSGSEGLVLDCHLEYEAAFNGGTGPDSEESYPERIELIYALVNGVDIAEVLCDDVKKLIEEEALCNMEMDGWNDAYDRAADRYEDRMCT